MDLHLLCLSTGQHWAHLSEYQWSNDCYEGFSVQPYLPYGGDVNILSPPQFTYLPSQFSLESPQPGPSGLCSRTPLNSVSLETVSRVKTLKANRELLHAGLELMCCC